MKFSVHKPDTESKYQLPQTVNSGFICRATIPVNIFSRMFRQVYAAGTVSPRSLTYSGKLHCGHYARKIFHVLIRGTEFKINEKKKSITKVFVFV